MLSRQEVNTMRHLANAQYWDRPAGGNTGRLFLAFGGPVCADRFSNCPLDRVLTYKNLIYLLNLQIVTIAFAILSLNMFLTYFLHLNSYFPSEHHFQGTTFVSFTSVTSTLKLKTHSQLTQSLFTGTDCLFLYTVYILYILCVWGL